MTDASPLHTERLLKGRSSRRIIYSSDDEDMPMDVRAAEVQECAEEPGDPPQVRQKQAVSKSKPDEEAISKSTHHTQRNGYSSPQGRECQKSCCTSPQGRDILSACSTPNCANSGQSPNEEHETIIKFTYNGESNWESETESETSTPDFKRGRFTPPGDHVVPTPEQELTRQAVGEIMQKGPLINTQSWVHNRTCRNPSVLILADGQLKHWPHNDKVCKVVNNDWPVKRWSQAIKMGTIRIQAHTVILYLEGAKTWADVPP